MILRDLIKDYPFLCYNGNLDIEIEGFNHDSRKIREKYIFIALEGFTVDGHDFISEAIANGAICIIHQRDCNKEKGITYIQVRDARDAFGFVSNRYYDIPWSRLKMIGVTGTNGKTSVSHFVKNILEHSGKKAGVIGTLGLIIDEDQFPLRNTTPDIQVILESINEMTKKDLDACIMEVSSHSLALERVEGVKFDFGVFTNLTKDHLDFHKNMEHYFQSKLKLFENTTKCNIINVDDIYGQRIIDILPSKPHITYGIDNKADIIATDIKYNIDGVSFNLGYKNEVTPIKLNVPGKFSVYNSLASIGCGLVFGIPVDTIKQALENLDSVKGRFEVLPINKNYNVIIDFAHTPDGLLNVLSIIRDLCKGKIIVVFGAGGDRDKSKRSIMGEIVGKLADYAIVTSDNPRNEDPKSIIDDILIGIKKTDVEYKAIIDRMEGIKYALDIVADNDIILLAGKGHEEKMIIGNREIKFNEREIVYQLIRQQ